MFKVDANGELQMYSCQECDESFWDIRFYPFCSEDCYAKQPERDRQALAAWVKASEGWKE